MNDLIETNADIREKCLSYFETLGFAKNLTDTQKMQFIEIAQAYQLNPFKREVYAVGYRSGEGVTMSIITGYEAYIKRAERTGKLNGWKCFINADGDSECHIWRKDWNRDEPFIHVLDKNEFVGSSPIWKNRKFMHKKVCTAQAFRLCFPDEMGGLPYTEAEDEYEHDIPVKTNSADDPMKKKRDKAFADIQKLYDGGQVPDGIMIAIDNAQDQITLNKIVIEVEDDIKKSKPEPEIDINAELNNRYKRIKKAWSLLKYAPEHITNSIKEHLGKDLTVLDDCMDCDKLDDYIQYLLSVHQMKGKAKNNPANADVMQSTVTDIEEV